ncbi:MAG: AraC family transcriptional regulator [Candidatus Brocadiia bacterium]
MAEEQVVAHVWPRPEGLRGAAVWADTVGELTGYGGSRRSAVLDALYPHLVTRGHGTFASGNGSFRIGPGDMFCVWPGIAHDFGEDPDDPWHFYWMKLAGEGAEPLARAVGFTPSRQTLRPVEPERAIRCFQAMFEFYARREDREPYRALSLLFELVSACRGFTGTRQSGSSRERLVREARALLVSLLDTGINVSGLADRLHVSRQVLLAAFRQELDTTPIDYIQSLRLERAKRLLAKTDLKVSVVARACGYGNEKYFYRRFRELTGLTPGSWRSEHTRQAADSGPGPHQRPRS